MSKFRSDFSFGRVLNMLEYEMPLYELAKRDKVDKRGFCLGELAESVVRVVLFL